MVELAARKPAGGGEIQPTMLIRALNSRLLWTSLAAAAMVAVVGLSPAAWMTPGQARGPAPMAQFGADEAQVAQRPRGAVRVMSFNIRHGARDDGSPDLEGVAQVIRTWGPDAVALQEVDVGLPRSGFRHQAAELAANLGMESRFAPAMGASWSGYGNAVLSRWPISEFRAMPLGGGLEPRGAAIATIEAPSGRFRLVSVHLGLSVSDRTAQVAALMERLPRDLPLVLAGDFNAFPDAPELEPILAELRDAGAGGQPTFPAAAPRARLDRVFLTADWGVLALAVGGSGPSDHLPVIADLEPSGAP